MQLVQNREGTPPGAHLLHRRLVELAPLDRELQRIDISYPLLPEEHAGLAADAGAPVHCGAEHVEDARADVHEIKSRLTMAWIPLLPSTSCVTCRSHARLQNTYASEGVQPLSATSQA